MRTSEPSDIRWRVYHAPPRVVASYLGALVAPDKKSAELSAAGRFSQRPLAVIAEVSFQALTTVERKVFLGDFSGMPEFQTGNEGPVKREARIVAPGVRECTCSTCGKPIQYRKREGAVKWGRPPKYHEACAPAHTRYWRDVAARRARREGRTVAAIQFVLTGVGA